MWTWGCGAPYNILYIIYIEYISIELEYYYLSIRIEYYMNTEHIVYINYI